MQIRVYIAPQQGDGTKSNPFRSIINNFINVHIGETFDEMDNPARRYSICIVTALDNTHASLEADSRIIVLSPLFADVTALKSGLDEPFSTWPQTLRQSALAALEERGVNTGWITLSHTPRDVYRIIIRVHGLSQILDGTRRDLLDLIRANLNVTVNQIPQALRTNVRSWMQGRGLAIDWITNQTTVREIVHFIVQNIGFSKLKFHTEEF